MKGICWRQCDGFFHPSKRSCSRDFSLTTSAALARSPHPAVGSFRSYRDDNNHQRPRQQRRKLGWSTVALCSRPRAKWLVDRYYRRARACCRSPWCPTRCRRPRPRTHYRRHPHIKCQFLLSQLLPGHRRELHTLHPRRALRGATAPCNSFGSNVTAERAREERERVAGEWNLKTWDVGTWKATGSASTSGRLIPVSPASGLRLFWAVCSGIAAEPTSLGPPQWAGSGLVRATRSP
ncbi:hypothetical protein VTI74DRAFT_6060 [Chaetomium olivicolor]